jgi:hypothetical protein
MYTKANLSVNYHGYAQPFPIRMLEQLFSQLTAKSRNSAEVKTGFFSYFFESRHFSGSKSNFRLLSLFASIEIFLFWKTPSRFFLGMFFTN